jgi:hypothetical protein
MTRKIQSENLKILINHYYYLNEYKIYNIYLFIFSYF